MRTSLFLALSLCAAVAQAQPASPLTSEEAKKALAERHELGQKAANLADAARRASPGDKPGLEAKRDKAILQWADAMFEEARRYEAQGQPTDAALRAEQILNELPAFPALEARRAQALEIFERGTEEGFRLAQERAAQGRYASAYSIFNHRRAGAQLPSDHPRNRWLAETRAQGAAHHRALAAEAEAAGLPGAALLHQRLVTLLETGESKGAQRGALRASLEPRWAFAAPPPSCAPLASILPAPKPEGGAPTPVLLEASCNVARREEVRDEPYEVEVVRRVKRKNCRDTYRTFSRPIGKDHVLTETVKGDPVCEEFWDEEKGIERRRRKVHHRFTSLRLSGTLTLGEGERAVSAPLHLSFEDDDQAYSSPDGNRTFAGGGEARAYVGVRDGFVKAVEERAPKYRAQVTRLLAARAEQAMAAGRALEAEDAWMMAAAAGAAPAAVTEWIGQNRGLGALDAKRLEEDADLEPLLPWSLPSQLPSPSTGTVARRPAWSGFSFRPDSRLDHMAWFFAAGGYAMPEDARLLSAASLSVGLEALRTNRASTFSLAWNWGGELGLDHHFSFLFDLHGGFGASVTLWRFTLAPMAMIGIDRMVIDGSDGSLVPLAFDYGGAGHLLVELGKGVALDGHAAYLFRTGGNPGELRTGVRLAITIGNRALFLGVRYHDYGRASAWTGFVGYGGD